MYQRYNVLLHMHKTDFSHIHVICSYTPAANGFSLKVLLVPLQFLFQDLYVMVIVAIYHL